MALKQPKNQQSIRFFGSLFSFLVCLFLSPFVGHAQTLPSGLVIGDDSGIYANSEGEYYIDLPSVLPGEHYEKTITIRSLDLKEPFELGLLVEPVSSKGIIDFNRYIQMTLSVDGKKLYQGPLLGDGSFDWRLEPLVLGTSHYGTDQILEVQFDVDPTLSNADFEEDSQLLYQWTFVGTQKNTSTKTETSESDDLIKESSTANSHPKGRLPQTGEERRNRIYQILIGFILMVVVLLLWKKRKEKERREQDE